MKGYEYLLKTYENKKQIYKKINKCVIFVKKTNLTPNLSTKLTPNLLAILGSP